MDGGMNLFGYGMPTLIGLLVLGAVILAALLWWKPAADHAGPTRPPGPGAVRWLQLGLLVAAGVFLLGQPLFALLLG